jgi:integrase
MKRGSRKPEAAFYLDRRETAALLYAAHAEVPSARGGRGDSLLYFLFTLQYLLALRVGEVILLRYEHLGPTDPVSGWPRYVLVPTLKKRASEFRGETMRVGDKTLPLLPVPVVSYGPLVAAAFNPAYRPPDLRNSPWLFPGQNPSRHISRSHTIAEFHRVREAARLPDYYSPHVLRHAAATNLYEKANRARVVSVFLRHATSSGRRSGDDGASVTDRYIHMTAEGWARLRGALDLPPLAPLAPAGLV